jgi:hypothetical protein
MNIDQIEIVLLIDLSGQAKLDGAQVCVEGNPSSFGILLVKPMPVSPNRAGFDRTYVCGYGAVECRPHRKSTLSRA